jgi:hypothetical protein
MKIYRRTLKCVLVWDMEPGPAARGLTARVGVGRVTKVTVDMDTDIAAALVVGGGCSMAAN